MDRCQVNVEQIRATGRLSLSNIDGVWNIHPPLELISRVRTASFKEGDVVYADFFDEKSHYAMSFHLKKFGRWWKIEWFDMRRT